MISRGAPKIGYIVKMYPRLSETFILNEILQHEKFGADITIFSYKKPNEGHFHPQVAQVRARVFYLEDLDPRKWPNWLGRIWNDIEPYQQRFLGLLGEALSRQDTERIELLMAAAWVTAQARQLGIEHFHAHFASIPSSIAYLASLISGTPFSFTAHAKDIFVYNLDEHMIREKLQAARFIVTVTNYNYDYLIERAPDIDFDKIKVIYNGVDLEKFKPDDTVYRRRNLILAVGRLVPKKGFIYLLEACGILKQKGLDFSCVIVGDGPELEILIQKRRELDLENVVEFAGPKRQDEVMSLMQSSAILCLPCVVGEDGNQDALPTVLLEALATGLPVVSTNISGIPEIVDSGKDGLLVSPNDSKSLSESLERLLVSEPLRKEYANRGLEKAAEKFDLRKNAARLFNLFRETQDMRIIEDTIAGKS